MTAPICASVGVFLTLIKLLQFDIGAYTMPRCFAMANFIFIYFHVEGLTESVSVG